MHAHVLSLVVDGTTLMVMVVVGVLVLGVVWFGLRFWLAATRPANILDIQTPSLDRINHQVLEKLGARKGDESPGDADLPENEEPPAELKRLTS